MERYEKELSSEGKEERELHNALEQKEDKEVGDKVLKKNNKEEGKEDGDSSCLWSLTTDAGISRHTTVFNLGITVTPTFLDEQLEEVNNILIVLQCQVTDKTVDGRRVTRLFTRIPESKNRLVEEQTSCKGGYKNTTVVGLDFKS